MIFTTILLTVGLVLLAWLARNVPLWIIRRDGFNLEMWFAGCLTDLQLWHVCLLWAAYRLLD